MSTKAPPVSPVRNRLAFYVLVVWAAFLAMHGYYFLLGMWNTPHPSYGLLLFFVLLQLLALLLAVIFGTKRLVYGPNRLKTAAWLALGILPVFIWYSQVSLAFHVHEERQIRQVEMRWYLSTTQPIATALIDGIARWTLPHRLEGERVVMFYNDKIADPRRDLEEMDAFIKKEEDYLQASMPAKIHWIRARMLGLQGGFAMAWLSIADPDVQPMSDQHTVTTLDLHEVAHNIIGIPSSIAVLNGTYPPTLLLEGWAMARTTPWAELVESCWSLKRKEGRALSIREAISPEFYNQIDYRLYEQGGALVYVLLDKFGPEKFWELYKTIGRLNVAQKMEQVYGMSLEELDELYWQEIESYLASKRSFERAVEKLNPHEGELLDELHRVYDKQREQFDDLLANVTLEWTNRSESDNKDGQTAGSENVLFQAKERNARWFRNSDWIKTSDDPKEETKRTDCVLLTPEAIFSTFQYTSNDPDKNKENVWRIAIWPGEQLSRFEALARTHLKPFDMLSLFFFGYGHDFSDPDDYLWNPPLGTVIEKVVEEGDDILLTLKPPANEWYEQSLTLRFDSKTRLLREAKNVGTLKDKGRSEWRDLRQYDTERLGFPITNKRVVEKNYTDNDGNLSRSAEMFALKRIDVAPVADTVFLRTNMPLDVDRLLPEERIHSEKRLRTHLWIIAFWSVISLTIIAWPHRRKPIVSPCGDIF